ncbi:MAG: ParM/StbA family protein [Anaerolineae bacterium]|nr:ParM/StbA family protein [Anaerolineae bacterium]
MSNRRHQLPLPIEITIGLDIGYGVVKAVTADKVITFPSVCGHAREIKFRTEDLAIKYPGEQLVDDDGSWFVGDLALSQLPPGELLRLRGRTANNDAMGNSFRLRLAKAAIGKLLTGVQDRTVVHVYLATGLPVDHMRDATTLKEVLRGQHYIKTDASELIANVVEVMVMPQPYGTIYAQLLTTNGDLNPSHTYRRTGVCDVGTYTIDLALDDDGEYVDAESGSIEGGVYIAQERIAMTLEARFRQKMPYRTVEEVLRTGCFRASGDELDLSQEVETALEPLRSATLNLLAEKWKTGANVDVIYLSGGGAELVHDQVKIEFRQAQLVRNAQLANARGYLSYALFKGKS